MVKDPALTPLGVMVLALLREGDMHPYEMARLLRARRDDRIVPISAGTLYHTVARLHGQGLLEEVGVDREGNRPERTTYAVTPAGTEAVREWVRRELGGSRRRTPFRVALAEAHNLERDEVVELLTQRLELLRHELETLSAALDGAATRAVPEQYLLEVLRHRLLLQADVDWLGDLIPRIASPEFSWGPDPDHLLAKRKAHHDG
ncbi:Transcriptional regulator PadR-like family protein [Microbacterium sp. 8M]|uniref:PadR family transcriptional regulator n=1 Tax=Microbacterium sp. 8M TaxID=2653153 RepID=UPI0012F01C85|nr:PadR family transcriptional regulator [Microbacterium sp. 8M]VXB45952.1 Transcriptional regulator PadR-like family protein [Microbacterium sp. 8M]